jgi:DNA-binding CsgD family transcriptional regulator
MTELSRLNEAERRVLLLLAGGHTAKSIATELETTPAAVNERLREARRKTGVGSSRELARLLEAQESCHEQIGVGNAADPVDSDVGRSGMQARSDRKVLTVMTGLLLIGLVAGALALQQGESSNVAGAEAPFSDPLIGNIFAPADPQKAALIPTTERDYLQPNAGENAETAIRRLHAQVRAEPRDEGAEAKLMAIYKSIHPIKLSKAPFRVICSQTLCEVATTTQVPTPQAEIDATLGEVQGAELRQRAEAIGLTPLYLWFGLHPSGDRAAYLGYWARTRAPTNVQAQSAGQAGTASNEVDPLFNSIFAEQDPTKLFTNPPKTKKDFDREIAGEGFRAMLRQFHAKVHSEPRDADWASPRESGLRAAFASIANVGVKGTELRVLCRSTLCEIAGTLHAPSRAKAEIDKFNHATMLRLNPKALEPDTDKLGLKSTLASFGTMSADRMSYVFYYSRVDAKGN